jgi:hypothetical protein
MTLDALNAVSPATRRLVDAVNCRVFRGDRHFDRHGHHNALRLGEQACDYLYALPGEVREPGAVFDRLRWGGQVIALTQDEREIRRLAQAYRQPAGFVLERGPRALSMGPMRGLIPLARERWYYLLARKTHLVRPGRTSERFTFHVELTRPAGSGEYAVLKAVPSYGSVMVRLKERFPDTPESALAQRARKLVERIFPVFLTREAAFLRLLQRDLPEASGHRVPHLLSAARDADGLVRKLCMNWLRLGTGPISQLRFALELTELVRALHEQARLLHLDLRMDNIVVTDHGVGLVDFGSAVRIEEDLSQSPMLRTLFSEMMSASQIQRLLGDMTRSGKVTSTVLTEGHQKIDKAADLFYLAMQIARPHASPDLAPLIDWDPQSRTARRISALTTRVLQPADPAHPDHSSAAEILADLRRIEAGLSPGEPSGALGG